MSAKPKPKPSMLVIGLTILGCLLILFFGLRALHAFRKFNGMPPPPSFAEEIETDADTIEDWMTIPFISHTYGVPPEILYFALNISPRENQKKSLREINDEYFAGQDGYVLETIKATVRAHQPPPMPGAPLTPLPPLTPVPPESP